MACAGSVFTSSNFPAPRYCEIIADMALRVCPRIQMSMDRKEPTIPAAARDSSPSTGIFPTIAVSVIESKGSAIPAIVAGIARLFMDLKLTVFFKKLVSIKSIHSNGRDVHFDLENGCPPALHTLVARKSFDFVYFG